MKRGLWLGGVLSALALTAACNWAGAWYGGPARPVNVLGTGCYVVFWAVFTFLAGEDSRLRTVSLAAGVIHFFSAVMGLLGRTWLGALALPFAAPAAVAFYGLSAWLGWTGLYAAAAVLSALWVFWVTTRR